MNETHIKVKGEWKYLYHVADKDGQTIDFLLTARRYRGSKPKTAKILKSF